MAIQCPTNTVVAFPTKANRKGEKSHKYDYIDAKKGEGNTLGIDVASTPSMSAAVPHLLKEQFSTVTGKSLPWHTALSSCLPW